MATLRASSDMRSSTGGVGRRLGGSYHGGREKLLRCNHARREMLLVDVLSDRGERRPVRREAVGPEVLAEDPPSLLDVIDQERQREMQCVGVVEAVERDVARRAERTVEALRHPGGAA